MTLEQIDPEHLKVLEEAAGKAHRECLFGGIGAVAKNLEDVEKTLKNIQEHRQQLEEDIGLEAVNRKVKSIKVKARDLRKQAKSMSRMGIAPRRVESIDWMSMTPEEIKAAEEKLKLESLMRTSPVYREIRENLNRKHGSTSSLVCPLCWEGDHGNRMGGKPYCYNVSKHKAKGVDGPVPLMTAEEAEEWTPPVKPKPKNLTFNEPENVMKWHKSQG